jgi:hypothetical protein
MRPRQNASERKSRKQRKKGGKTRSKRPTNWVGILSIFFVGCFGSYMIFEILGEKRSDVGSHDALGSSGGVLKAAERVVKAAAERDVQNEALGHGASPDLHQAAADLYDGQNVRAKGEEIPSNYHATPAAKETGKPTGETSGSATPPAMPPLVPKFHAANSVNDATNVMGGCNLDPVSLCKMENPGIVILTHDREEYVTQTLKSLIALPEIKRFNVYVSIDDPNSYNRLELAVQRIQRMAPGVSIATWRKPRPSTFSHPFLRSALSCISQHFKFVMERGFHEIGHSHLIMIEDDLLLGKDFLKLFEETAWLIKAEPEKTFCVSAWNDNGLKNLVRTSEAAGKSALMRTGYFPGLGWMTTKEVWNDLRNKWPERPTTGWDHWIRLSTSMNGRECIIPEIPRTKHISSHGTNVNSAQAVKKFQKYAFIDETGGNPNGFPDTRALLSENYATAMQGMVSGAVRVRHLNEVDQVKNTNMQRAGSNSFLVLYKREEFERLAPEFGLFPTQARGWHEGIIISRVPQGHSQAGRPLLLADVRKAKYIKVNERMEQNTGTLKVAAARGQSCEEACRARKKGCLEDQLEFLNTCESFSGIFPCEAGCGHQIGAEIPCYVADRTQPTYQQCLITDHGTVRCGSKHMSTQRICACG